MKKKVRTNDKNKKNKKKKIDPGISGSCFAAIHKKKKNKGTDAVVGWMDKLADSATQQLSDSKANKDRQSTSEYCIHLHKGVHTILDVT